MHRIRFRVFPRVPLGPPQSTAIGPASSGPLIPNPGAVVGRGGAGVGGGMGWKRGGEGC